MPVCDGCGRSVDEAHIRRRIERLEMATRFRPVHIGVLLIDAAPPARQEDFFYATCGAGSRSAAGQSYFNEMAKLAGAAASGAANTPGSETDAILAEFQRHGFFLTHAVECPMDDASELTAAIRRLARTALLRVQTSYKPKHVALISAPTAELIETFRAGGWAERLLLENGRPFTPQSVAIVSSQVA